MKNCSEITFLRKSCTRSHQISVLTWVAYAEAFVASSVIEGPVQVDFVTGTSDAERTGIVTT